MSKFNAGDHNSASIRSAETWEIVGKNGLFHVARYNYGAKVHGDSAPNKYDVEFPNFIQMADFVSTYELQERTTILPQFLEDNTVNHYHKFNDSVVVSIDLSPKENN